MYSCDAEPQSQSVSLIEGIKLFQSLRDSEWSKDGCARCRRWAVKSAISRSRSLWINSVQALLWVRPPERMCSQGTGAMPLFWEGWLPPFSRGHQRLRGNGGVLFVGFDLLKEEVVGWVLLVTLG